MRSLFLISAFLLSHVGGLKPETLDKSKSSVSFSISNLYVNTVEGSFSDFTGKVVFDAQKPENSTFKIKIPVSSIDTENKDRDKHLQAEEYFNSEKFPYIIFTSSFVKKTALGLDITGNLSIKGVSKKFTIPFTYSKNDGGYLLKGNFELDRYDFKVGSDGSFSMGIEVNLKIDCYIKS